MLYIFRAITTLNLPVSSCIFMHVPDEDFVEGPECVALLDNRRYCLNINL